MLKTSLWSEKVIIKLILFHKKHFDYTDAGEQIAMLQRDKNVTKT